METPARITLVISGARFINTTNTGTTLTWTTNKLSTSVVEYGKTSSYGQSVEDKNQNTDHVMTLSDLNSGTTYHARIKGTDADGNTTTSDDYVVDIPATPSVSSLSITDIRFNQATVNWQSNVPADSKVELTIQNKETGESVTSEQGQSDLGTTHAVTVIGLSPNTLYHFKVKSTDTYGNTAESEERTFSTPNDTEAPKIANVKSEVTTSGAGDNIKIMAIISWTTNEPATSQVEYGMGMSGTYPNKTDESLSYNMAHMVTIPDLRPNASYRYRIIAKDAAGNLSKGEDLSLITPPKDKSLLQMVLKSLEETFSWVKRLPEAPVVRKFKGGR
jgi:chitodextrinase